MKSISVALLLFIFSMPGLYAQNKISLSFNGLPSLEAKDNNVQIQKFSDYLKITASGETNMNGRAVAFSISLSCPKFNFIDGKENHYQNASNYFLDARADAILSVTIDTATYANVFRSKNPADVISHVSTTHYRFDAKNISTKNDAYQILLSIAPGTILNQSSETLPAAEVKSITVSNGSITIVNPQPALPKVKSSFIEVTGETIQQSPVKH